MQAVIIGDFLQILVPFPGRICFFIDRVQIDIFPDRAFGPCFEVAADRVGCIGLQFYGVGAGLRRLLDNQSSLVEITFMVA